MPTTNVSAYEERGQTVLKFDTARGLVAVGCFRMGSFYPSIYRFCHAQQSYKGHSLSVKVLGQRSNLVHINQHVADRRRQL